MERLLFFEILVLKNIRRCTHEPKANLLITRLAVWKRISRNHHHFMCRAMFSIMHYFVNPRLLHRVAWLKTFGRKVPAASARASDAATLVDAKSYELWF